MAGIEFRQVTKRYGSDADALRGLSLTLPEGSMTFLSGHSGAGKSTFLRLLLRLEAATSGSISVNGVDIAALAPRHLPYFRQHFGVVLQQHRLLAERNVFDNVALPLRVAGMTNRDAARRVRAALSSVGILDKGRLLPGNLSAGERQRVGIARAVVNRPKVLLADEPTGNLDPTLSRSVMGLFRQFSDVGVTVIVASHDIELVSSMGARIVVLTKGSVVSDTAPVAAAGERHGG